jgi:hypothetical protein
MPKRPLAPWRFCRGKGRENFSLAKNSRNPLISLDLDERIQGNPRKSNAHNLGFRSETAGVQDNPNAPRFYSDVDAVFAFVSLRWCLKSPIEANWNVPSPVSASIEPSEKIL